MCRVAVIDYGMGNLRSVSKALEAVADNAEINITSDPEQIQAASHIVFPGVGAMRDCMAELTQRNLHHVIRDAAQQKPFLGICLGMQALLSHSEENSGVNCLDIIPGNVRHFDTRLARDHRDFKVPHMGWNEVEQTQSHPLWQGIDNHSRFYFVHSYYVAPQDEAVTLGRSDYQHDFTAAIGRDNVFAVQFHPEKSQTAGLQLLKNFLHWDGQC